jgi:ribose 5-phosphate isomerase B
MRKVHIGADHAGFDLKEKIKLLLSDKFEVLDYGTYSGDSVDYPDYAHPVADAVEKHEEDFGILICGSANGVAMAANKHKQIRAAICWLPEIAELARLHNNANVVCIPARFVSTEMAEQIVQTFMSTSFEGGRHEKRVNKIGCL